MDDRPAAPPETPRRRRVVLWVVLGLLVVAALLLGGQALAAHLESLEAWLASLGALGMLAFVVVFVLLTTVFVPDTALALVAGALFGLAWGTVLVSIGGLLGASLQWLLARTVLHARIQGVVDANPRLAAIQTAVQRREVVLQVLLRLTPLNPTMVSYVLGAAGVRFPGFLLACLGLIPLFFLEVYLGVIGRRLGAAETSSTLETALLWGGLGVSALVVVIVARIAARAVREATNEGV